MTSRADEIVEAVRLLHDLGKPDEFIGNQLDISPAAIPGIIKSGRVPARQQTLFGDSNELQKQKPVSRLAPWKQALKK